MLKGRESFSMEHNINGHRDFRDTENGRGEHDLRPPGPPKRSPVQKTGWNVIEISSSSENEEETGSLLSASPNGLENGESAGKSPIECWALQKDRPNNMLRRDYGKKTPYRIFQVPASPKATAAGKEEFYNYLGISSKPLFTKTVDLGEDFLNRRSLRVCFRKKWKEHRAKMTELEKVPQLITQGAVVCSDTAKDIISSPNISPSVIDINGTTIKDRRNYIQITASDEEESSEVKHKVCDLSHQPLNGDEISKGSESINEKTAKRERDMSRKSLRKSRKRIHKKIFKPTYTYFIRSSLANVLRSGKVRDTDRHFLKTLQKRYKKNKQEQSVKSVKDTTKSAEVIILTDDDDPVEIVQMVKTTEKPKQKVLDESLGQVQGVHLFWPSLLILQMDVVSFWTCSEITSILTSQQNWVKVGEIMRSSKDVDIPAVIEKRIFDTDSFGCVYMEMRGKILPRIARQETDYSATYINVHYLKNGEGIIRSIALDRICGMPKEMCYTTLPDSLSFIMTWYEQTTSTKRRTGICRYSLTPDLETLASIWEFDPVDNRVRSLTVASEQRVIGVGDQNVSIWNCSNGNLLTTIDLAMDLGDNLFTYLVQENRMRYLFLTQLYSNTIKTVAINLLDFQYVILHMHENVNLTIDSLRSSTVSNGMFVASFTTGEILMLKAHQSTFMRRKKVDSDTNIFFNGEYIVEINDKIAIRSLLDFLT